MSNYVYEEKTDFSNLLALKMRFYGENPDTNEFEEISLTPVRDPEEISLSYAYHPNNTNVLWDFLYKENGSGIIKSTTLTFGLSLTQRTTDIFTKENLNNIKAAIYVADLNLTPIYFLKKFEFSNFLTKTNTEISTGPGITIYNSIYIKQGNNAVAILITFDGKLLPNTINESTPVSALPSYEIIMF